MAAEKNPCPGTGPGPVEAEQGPGSDPAQGIASPALYRARVMHLRRMPDGERVHRFAYRVFRVWLDVDRLGQDDLRWLSHNRANLLSIRDRDHGPRDGSALRPWADALLARHGVARPARLMLYTFPRLLGYAFNPLSMYLGIDGSGIPTSVIYEVRNTDTDMSHYVFPLTGPGPWRHGAPKKFYVSPFISPEQSYAFTLSGTGDTLAMRIRVDGEDGLTMLATENADREPLTDRALLAACVAMPLMTFKVIAGIYWEAARLRLKGARFFRHPGNAGRYDGTSSPATDRPSH